MGELLILNMNAYIEREHMMLINIFLCMHKFRESILDSFDKCFVIIKNGEIVEPLFDFDDTKTLLLWFIIKLLSVSEMNLISKAKVSFRMLKIQHPSGGFESYMKMIRILILESVFGGKEVKFTYEFESSKFEFKSRFHKAFSEVKKMKFSLQIRIPEIWIRISILESFLKSDKMKFGLRIRIPNVKV